MRTFAAAAAAAVAVALVLGGAEAATPAPGLEGTFWAAEGTVQVLLTVKKAGSFKAKGAFPSAACDLIPGQASLFLHELSFEGVAGDPLTSLGYRLDTGTYGKSSVHLSSTTGDSLGTLEEFLVAVYDGLAGGGVATIGGTGLSLRAVPAASLGDLAIDPASIAAKGLVAGVKRNTAVTGNGTIRFDGVLTSGPLADRAVQGRITVKFRGVPHGVPGALAR